MSLQGLLIGVIVAGGPAAAPSDAELLEQATAAYKAGIQTRKTPFQARRLFGQAAALYEQLRGRGVRNGSLERNLGQAYLLAGDLPRAILAYRRGLELAPGDGKLGARLDEARERVNYSSRGSYGKPPVDNWPPWLPRPSPYLQLGFLVIVYGLGCVCFTRWWMTREGSHLALGGVALAVAVFLGVWLVLGERQRDWERDHPVVVIVAERVVLQKGDGANYPWYDAATREWQEAGGPVPADAPALPRGAEARLRFRRGAWVQIELAGGETGWVRRADVVLDGPE
jgi:hypothetical protein